MDVEINDFMVRVVENGESEGREFDEQKRSHMIRSLFKECLHGIPRSHQHVFMDGFESSLE